MSWSVHYQAMTPRNLSEKETSWLNEHSEEWSENLDEGTEPYSWFIADLPEKLWGITKINFSDDPSDFNTLIGALQEVEERFPDLEIKFSDDYLFNDWTSPASLGDWENAIQGLK